MDEAVNLYSSVTKKPNFSFGKLLRVDLTDCHQCAPDMKEACHNCVIMFQKAYAEKYIHVTEEETPPRKNSSILPTLTVG